jgi:hypothetical protein
MQFLANLDSRWSLPLRRRGRERRVFSYYDIDSFPGNDIKKNQSTILGKISGILFAQGEVALGREDKMVKY